MKFVHIADIHFDRPFVNLSDRDTLGDLRRLAQRKAFKKVIEYIKENDISYLFISGDLYEHKYVKQSTIEYINNLCKEIPNTQILIAPGNHDPYLKHSYYSTFQWNDNIKIFSSKIEKIEGQDVDIYGYGFDDFYCTDSKIEQLEIENPDRINILVSHGTIDGSSLGEKQYNPMSRKKLEEKGFDYIALGHIHKPDYQTKMVYPGSMISRGFDELGEHGMIVGEIQKGKIDLEFVPLDEDEFKEIEIEITNIDSKEELIEKINEITIKDNEFVKIILVGNRNFEIDSYDLIKYMENDRIIKIKDNTKLAVELTKMTNENTLKGLFAKKMLEKLSKEDMTQEEINVIQKAIEIGLESLL